MKQLAKVHDNVSIGSGRYKGLMGVVTETKEGSARVKIDGVQDDETVSAHVWVRNSSLTVVV